MKPMGIYIHIPFCMKKCEYCDFVSFAGKEDKMLAYTESLRKELEMVGKQNAQDKAEGKDDLLEIETIYLGGGTPSFLPAEEVEKILATIRENFILKKNCEITIEINPGTTTKEKLEIYQKAGINRLSIGLQSIQEHVLKVIGRIHDYEKFEEVYQEARELGFQNINVDLMIGLPKQNVVDVEKSVEQVIHLKPEHISVYSFIVEEGTPMAEKIAEGSLTLPKEEVERKEYWTVKKMLEEAGYIHYEISNFAKMGKESKHNTDCWNQKEYMGFGIAAHSYTDGIRYSNLAELEPYMENIQKDKAQDNFIFHEKQDEEAKMKEYMLLGLRKIAGVEISKFKEKYGINPIYCYRLELDQLVRDDLVEVDDDFIKLTKRGIDLANLVWKKFV